MNESEEFTRLNNAYHTAIELWKLASDQIYSRFSAMLTANSIILAVIGLTISERVDIPSWFVWVLIIGGFVLCLIWIGYMAHGTNTENHYRRIAESLESKVLPDGRQVVIRVDDSRYKGFLPSAFLVVWVFCAIYLAVILLFAFISHSS